MASRPLMIRQLLRKTFFNGSVWVNQWNSHFMWKLKVDLIFLSCQLIRLQQTCLGIHPPFFSSLCKRYYKSSLSYCQPILYALNERKLALNFKLKFEYHKDLSWFKWCNNQIWEMEQLNVKSRKKWTNKAFYFVWENHEILTQIRAEVIALKEHFFWTRVTDFHWIYAIDCGAIDFWIEMRKAKLWTIFSATCFRRWTKNFALVNQISFRETGFHWIKRCPKHLFGHHVARLDFDFVSPFKKKVKFGTNRSPHADVCVSNLTKQNVDKTL